MAKDILIHQIVDVLEVAGFIVSDRCNIRPRSFDLAARKDDILLFCKVLYNIDGLNKDTAHEMKTLAQYFGGSVLVVGAKTRNQFLEDNVVYVRYDIPSLNIQTLFDYFIEEVPPLVSAAPGGLYISIDGNVLKSARMDRSLSLGALASQLGVSRRTISKYEEGGMDASIDIVLQIEELLDIAIARSIDILKSFEKKQVAQRQYSEKVPDDNILSLIHTLGYDVLPTSQAPFKAISSDGTNVMLTGVSEYSSAMIKRAHLMSSISKVTMTQSVFIIEGHSKLRSVDSTVLIEQCELDKLSDCDELDTLVHERKKKQCV
ncbi:MAG: transcriptional regulator [Methanosarcinaceae archaeon]